MNKNFFLRKKFLVISFILLMLVVLVFIINREPEVDYNTQVKPILNAKCISCHGGVKAKAGFSVLFREEALGPTESGKPAIIPGDAEGSEMIRRITLKDPEERMPYKHEPLSEEEISILTRWIKQGAKWGEHWAYLPVAEVKIPEPDSAWGNGDIDAFILEKLREVKLAPSVAADKPTILRRVSLDLTGVYPDSMTAAKFLGDTTDNAYSELVDSMLASPRFGERWAAMWLDLARYADTKGYESDYARNIWQYRDWVIKAFNEDKSYDRFLTEQIAGDLLPDPDEAKYLATAFHRNAMSNDEGGTSNEEFRNSANIDRVNTTWEALMGTTFACVQCHSHPYDPFRHEEYYQFLAYFNNNRDEDVPMEFPLLREFADSLKPKLDSVYTWMDKYGNNSDNGKIRHFIKTWQPALNYHDADSLNEFAVLNNNTLVLRKNGSAMIPDVDMNGVSQLITGIQPWQKFGSLEFRLDSLKGTKLGEISFTKKTGYRIEIINFPKQTGVHDLYLTYHNEKISDKNQEYGLLFYWAGFMPEFPGKDEKDFSRYSKLFKEVVTMGVPATPIMLENPANRWRKTKVFDRGNWLTQTKEVEPGVPQIFQAAMPAEAPQNRLGLSMWLTNKQNPLVSRTIVNRLWEQLFGTGIVETLEDLGTQGLLPSHKDLLDHLSWKLMHEYTWSLKKLLKEMVMSATYRQDSKLTEDMKVKDLFNRYYARGPRVRLTAEQIRDQGLCISGSLSTKMYGPGVMPWQPDGIWLSPYNGSKWETSRAEDQYRRAVYTYWKRSSPYPSMITFDGTQRVVCNARRIRTNTPLQALVTLNDSTYLNMARHLAFRLKANGDSSITGRIKKAYELMLFKPIPAGKLDAFSGLYQTALEEFKTDADRTCEMVGINDGNNNPETAALVVVANAMLNMDEMVTKN